MFLLTAITSSREWQKEGVSNMTVLLRKMFRFISNERGETVNGVEQDPNVEAGTSTVAPATVQPTTDWEDDGNPYKKRYGDSQSQIQPLVRTLQSFAEYDHNTKTWKPKTQAQPTTQVDDVDRLLEGYDPEFRKVLVGYTQKQIDSALNKFQEQSTELQRYNSKMFEGRNRAIEEFGSEFDFAKEGKMNPASPLYQLANEILTNKYVELNPDGTFHKYSHTEAEYLSTAEAYALLSKRAKTQPLTADKGKLNAIQGKGSKAAGIKKNLSYEDYFKLSPEEKDAYDLSQSGG